METGELISLTTSAGDRIVMGADAVETLLSIAYAHRHFMPDGGAAANEQDARIERLEARAANSCHTGL